MKIMELLKDPEGIAFVSGIVTSLIVCDNEFLVTVCDEQGLPNRKKTLYRGKSEKKAVEAFLKHEQNL